MTETKRFYVKIPFDIKSKSNYRHSRKNRGKWEALANFEMLIRHLLKQNIPEEWDLGNKAVAVSERPIIAMVVSAKSRLDAANFSKSIADAAEGLIYHNDKSVRYPLSESLINTSDSYVGFAWIPPHTDPATCRVIAAELLRDVPNLGS